MKQIRGVDLTNDTQKIFAVVLIIIACIVLYNILPALNVLIMMGWKALFYGVPLAAIILYVCLNPGFVWSTFKGWSFQLTRFLISKDKLGYMYRYHEHILAKIESVKKSATAMGAVKIELARAIQNADKEVKQAEREERIAVEAGNAGIARVARTKVVTNMQLIQNSGARLEQVSSQEKALCELINAWTADAEELKYTLDAKAQEYRMIETMNTATGNAKEFLGAQTEQKKIYDESLRQIEASTVQWMANIESFDREARPKLEAMQINQNAKELEGIEILRQYREQGKISLKEMIELPAASQKSTDHTGGFENHN